MAGYSFVAVVVMGLLQHIVHESAHMLVARSLGVRVHRVQWFTYAGLGTRVFYIGEPSMTQERIETKWGLIALGGLAGTSLAGYGLTLLYLWGAEALSVWPMVLLFYGSVLFLITDPISFILGAIFSFGDAVGVMKVFRLRNPTAGVLFALPLIPAGLAILRVWYP